MREKRTVRSSHFQHIFNELTIPSELMESFGNTDSIQNRLNPWVYDETLLSLEDELKKEFWRVVDECLTDRQREVLKMMADGYTQMEIGKKLGISQSTVVKCAIGSQILKGDEKIFYGGSYKRLRQVIEEDKKIIALLQKMKEVREEKF